MFGIGIGEIFVVILIVFLISPKELPKVMKKIGQFFNEMNRLKREVMQLKKDVEDIVDEGKVDLGFIEEEIPLNKGGKKKTIQKKNPAKKEPPLK
ncbi:MAG: twin-arginine translocase TatA/TatE family subunit [Spirochaetales bacterium]|nr:twin-arginine translocase TatA/TatE family subunit [Spirochaetales bacterium]